MAYIGQVLKNPETGWRRYDDSDALITYEGAWEIRGSSSAAYGKYHICGGKSKIQFSFEGSKLRIIGSTYKFWTGTVNVEIDGEKCGSYNIYDPNSLGENSVLLYEKNDLQYATHNVVLHADSTSTLDALDFGEPGGLVVPIKVGDVLKEPESGWKRFDDTDSNIRYTGVWANSTHSDFYNSTLHFKHSTSNNPPDKNPVSLKFNFIGTRLRVIGLMNSSYDANATILVDGVEEIISFFRPGSQSQTLVYEKIGLMNQEHTVEIKGYFINLDAIDIDADGELVPFKQEKTKVSLYEKESGKIFVDNFDSVNSKWLMSPSNSFNNAIKKGFLRMNHSADKDVMLLIDKPQSNFATQVIADYAPTKEGDEGGLLIYQNEKNKVEFLESYSSNSSQINKEWMAICKEDQWDFYTKTDTFFDYADNDSLAAKRIGVVLKRGTAEGFVPLDINKIIMTTSNMLRLRQLYENYKVVLKDTADNILSTNIVAAAHTGIDILLPSLEFEGIIEIYDEENELIAKKQATFYGGDMYCMGSSLQIKMNSEELNTTDPTNLGYMVNNERIVKMTIVNDNIGAATNIKLSIQQYMEKVGYTWALISLDGTSYSNEIQIDSVTAQSTRDFWVKVVKDTNFLAFEPIYFNIHLKHN
ncbi:hypothetical protein ICM_01422 [Bacillus cereus BAG1X2-3]|uniref:hypothetical protein n=1 Tax=Bacillus cereus TaxID=1396 RepID=UPI00032E1534|nr:hypothetical protein [Bacillus cereus]EOO27105.1 hypothetical protein ICC_03396 [Bacillus cereus BAG1X1-1]EOO49467.1 hypothetical protein ICI_01985 [Bacillus cereus BAG1X2-1]EOO51527.1 hypothetical protein ICK_03367 [Bacillus cereus BAG1X2-2]EOO60502.1 hypothetical protein ICM_01422 [Bacillus cereus BAG1X2-3]EOP06763.1 hypothetical protein ICO_01984 [Bacillus cereus BAG2O-1]